MTSASSTPAQRERPVRGTGPGRSRRPRLLGPEPRPQPPRVRRRRPLAVCDPASDALGGSRVASPALAQRHRPRDAPRRRPTSRPSRSPPRCRRTTRSPRGARGGQARLRREAARRLVAEAPELVELARAAQPAFCCRATRSSTARRSTDPRPHPIGRARRDLLRLDEPREPRPPPDRRRAWRGTSARTTSRSCGTGSRRPRRVSAIARSCIIPDGADVAFINLEYASGTIAHVELSWLAPSKLRRTTIVGSRKMLLYDDMSHEPVRIFDSGVSFSDPETFGEFQLSYRMRRHRLAADCGGRAAAARDARLLRCRPRSVTPAVLERRSGSRSCG